MTNNTSLPAASENWVWAEDSALGPCQQLFQGLLLPGTHHRYLQTLTPDPAWWSLLPVDTSAPQLPAHHPRLLSLPVLLAPV